VEILSQQDVLRPDSERQPLIGIGRWVADFDQADQITKFVRREAAKLQPSGCRQPVATAFQGTSLVVIAGLIAYNETTLPYAPFQKN